MMGIRARETVTSASMEQRENRRVIVGIRVFGSKVRMLELPRLTRTAGGWRVIYTLPHGLLYVLTDGILGTCDHFIGDTTLGLRIRSFIGFLSHNRSSGARGLRGCCD